MTPNTYKRLGSGEEIGYVIANSPLGFVIVAATKRGICNIRLGNNAEELESDLQREFSNASLEKGNPELFQWMQSLIDYLSGNLPLPNLLCDVKATAFQLQVWNTLQAIPPGTTVTYSDIADAIGQPNSVRAVARACATNPVALVIPCHRVVPKAGGVGGYRWGSFRKEKLIDLEKEYATTQTLNLKNEKIE